MLDWIGSDKNGVERDDEDSGNHYDIGQNEIVEVKEKKNE